MVRLPKLALTCVVAGDRLMSDFTVTSSSSSIRMTPLSVFADRKFAFVPTIEPPSKVIPIAASKNISLALIRVLTDPSPMMRFAVSRAVPLVASVVTCRSLPAVRMMSAFPAESDEVPSMLMSPDPATIVIAPLLVRMAPFSRML